MPISAIRCGGRFRILWPSIRMSPALGWYSLERQLKSVVLPAPFGPIRRRIWPCCMSKDTPFKAMMPPNTTLTSRTASRGEFPCASCACVISFRPNNPPGWNDRANLSAGHNDEGYLIPSTTRATFPPAFNFLLSSFFDCGAAPPSAAGLAHHFLAKRFGQMPNAEIGKGGIAQRHGGGRQLVFLEPRNRRKVAQLGQSIGQPGDGRLWQIGTGRDLLIAKKPVVGLECAQHIKAAGQRDDEAAIGRRFLGWTFHCLLLCGPRLQETCFKINFLVKLW